MLKFLTHKLRTHSLNEENVSEKVEERDSGTESDDEADRTDSGEYCTDVVMKWNDVTDISMGGEACARAPAPARPLPGPEPDHMYDHHSSEEELEVINGAPRGGGGAGAGAAGGESRRRGASSPPRAGAGAAPEKRKWPAQAHAHAHAATYDSDVRPPSSDDDDTKVETPVRFRTSPPLEALKPRRGAAGGSSAGAGGAHPAPPSPRRRRAPLAAPRRHRPALDFDKMQQLKVGGGVRSWRAVGGASGELSVFCW